MVCVDHTPRDRLPSFVRSVPTLVLGPNVQPLVGERAFAWLEQQASRAPPPQAHMQGGKEPKLEEGGPAGWQIDEMGSSMSDSYSFIEEATTNAIPKNFEFIGHGRQGAGVDVTKPFPQMENSSESFVGSSGVSERAPNPSGGGAIPGSPNFSMASPQSSFAKDELSARMEELRNMREKDSPHPTARIG